MRGGALTAPSVPGRMCGRCAGLVQVWCRILSDAAAADPARDAARRTGGDADARRPACSIRRGAREAIPGTPNDRRNPLVELPEPAEVAASPARRACSSRTCISDHLDDTAVDAARPRRVPAALPAARRAARCASAASPTCAPSTTRSTGTAIAITRTGGQHGTGEIGRACWRRCRASCCARPTSPCSTSPATPCTATRSTAALDAHDARRRGRQRRRRPLHGRRPDHDDRRRRRRRRPPARP